MTSDFTIRPFVTIEEYRECVTLQEDTWGHGFSERVSPAILKVSQILGGVSAGAYNADDRLVGFVFGMTGVRDGEVVHWSDMLAVRPEVRDSGLGRRLKEYQREAVMRIDVEKMFWTFDPLQSRNAYLNLEKLGIVVREYREDMYGQTDSPLHRGIGTDRCVALWLLSSDRVRSRLDSHGSSSSGNASHGSIDPGDDTEAGEAPYALFAEDGDDHPEPGEPRLGLRVDAVRVAIPSDIGSLMSDDMGLAVRWRGATRAVFRHYLDAGYEAVGFTRGLRTSAYRMARRRDVEA